MSSFVFPLLPGQKFPARKSPNFSTKRQKALSGKESALSFRAYPLYSWELEYEFLSDNFPQALARTNYVAYSQDVTQWIAENGGTGLPPVIIGNYTQAPDGTITADRVVMNKGTGSTAGDFSGVLSGISSGLSAVTISCWLRTNDGSTVSVLLFNSSNASGSIFTVTPNWQRFSVLSQQTTTSNSFALLLQGTHPTANYADLSVWGAQAEDGNYATPNIFTNGSAVRVSDLKTMFGIFSQMLGSYDTFLYQDQDFNTVQLQQFATGDGATKNFNLTATYKAGADISQFGSVLGNAGSPEWVQNTNGPPQIYTARYGGPELLSTGSRTNLALQSSNFGASATWAAAGTVTTGAGTAPDGTTTANKFTEGSATQQWYVLQSIGTSLSNANRYTFSAWLKYIGRQYVSIVFDTTATDAVYATFDLVNGVFSSVGTQGTGYASNADVHMVAHPNGWYRCAISGTLYNDSSGRVGICPATSAAAARYPSIAGLNADSFYMWGAQFEVGTQQTAYIPTTTATASNGGSDYSLTNLTTSGSVNTFQQVSFASATAYNVPLLWSGSFYYRCRFDEDSIDFQKDFGSANAGAGIWSSKRVSFGSVIL